MTISLPFLTYYIENLLPALYVESDTKVINNDGIMNSYSSAYPSHDNKAIKLLLAIQDAAALSVVLWQLNLYDYKRVLNWLNSEYWANLENWDKKR